MVEVFIEVDSKESHFSIKGHAHYNPGNDIVCSAISAVGYAALGTLKHYSDTNNKCFELKYAESAGNIECRLEKIRYSWMGTIITIFHQLEIGLKQIELIYPEYIKVFSNI